MQKTSGQWEGDASARPVEQHAEERRTNGHSGTDNTDRSDKMTKCLLFEPSSSLLARLVAIEAS